MARLLGWAFKIGGIAFAIGFIGPMILRPDANQGPLLGISVTGPLGFLAGVFCGAVIEQHRPALGAVSIAYGDTGRMPGWFRR